MHTFFNLKIKETNDRMRLVLKSHVDPFLKAQGWMGRNSTYKRIINGQHQILEVQFNKWGGSFAVNLSIVEPIENFYAARSGKLKCIRSQRLGSRNKRISKKQNMDHWFKFMLGVLIYIPAYKLAASELLKIYNTQAELTFNDMQESANAGVACIHLEKI
ncbi:DUF4304 domain-containing protein [Cellvibrio sp. PSBB023]|uniref:DUF4304 domain-containing protein n=1 Tax=Cellvibrio sp. PSBB023 TaxID=1945512 RepID=UPI00098E9658|nr:DUF4304 domain-containing protein [Cellvibrio sp. PSBB023]AQT60339.1 hypothetical protein B0D95_09705 [Cellvibrio sp. PSBB023]